MAAVPRPDESCAGSRGGATREGWDEISGGSPAIVNYSFRSAGGSIPAGE